VQALAKQNAVVVHRYPLWRDGLKQMLLGLGFEAVAATESVDEALALVESERPALLVAGQASRGGESSGIECVRRARGLVPELKAVVLAASYDEAEAEAALAAGAYAYVVETTHADDIQAAIRQGFQASVFLGPGDAATPPRPASPPLVPQGRLTKRELEILRLVAEGRSNGQVARKLWVTEQTVKFHLSNIYRKIGVANRTEASRWAQVHGLLDGASTRERASG
jgi:DNA-binding NarL/FixJ family response regulator